MATSRRTLLTLAAGGSLAVLASVGGLAMWLLRPRSETGAPEPQVEAAPEPAPDMDAAALDQESVLAVSSDRWKGDLDGMLKRRVIRVLTPVSQIYYFQDGGRERGIDADLFREFEKQLNDNRGKGAQVHVLFKAVPRDQLIAGLLDGRGDIAVGNLTVTPERQAKVAFAPAIMEDVREVVVQGPAAPKLASLDDLAGQSVLLRRSSSYWASATALAASLQARGRQPLLLEEAPEELEDEDILEMVEAGILPFAIVDDHKARFWTEVMPRLKLREDLVLRRGARIAWAHRKRSPKLATRLAAFATVARKGTLLGNVVLNRYLTASAESRAAMRSVERQRFQAAMPLFRKYGAAYGFDPLMLAAQGFQESGLDPKMRSPVGAIGIMQVMPATAADKRVAIRNIERSERNIEAAAKYMRVLQEDYFADLGQDRFNRTLFSFAAYNAGPTRLSVLRKTAASEGLDPQVWFENVETVVARVVGREPVDYVRNIFKYYVGYMMIERQNAAREIARAKLGL